MRDGRDAVRVDLFERHVNTLKSIPKKLFNVLKSNKGGCVGLGLGQARELGSKLIAFCPSSLQPPPLAVEPFESG